MESQKTQNCQSNPEEKEKKLDAQLPQTADSTTKLQQEKRDNTKQKQTYGSMEQSGKPRNKPMACGLWSELIYNKGGKNTNIEKSLFHKWFWVNWTATCKENSEHPLISYIKINPKPIKDLR